MSKPKPVKCCSTCKHYAVELCEDDAGNKVPRALTVSNQEPFWAYETCAKNWGLPKVACTDGSRCQLWVLSNKEVQDALDSKRSNVPG